MMRWDIREGLHCLYQHHEQACAMAAESYARIHNKIGLLCVTTGPGGTNAITGCSRWMAGLHSYAGFIRSGCAMIPQPVGPEPESGLWETRSSIL